jgi:hypothetical protein
MPAKTAIVAAISAPLFVLGSLAVVAGAIAAASDSSTTLRRTAGAEQGSIRTEGLARVLRACGGASA